jgi:hypothetical protein
MNILINNAYKIMPTLDIDKYAINEIVRKNKYEQSYIDYLQNTNGGYYCKGALHFFGVSDLNKFHDLRFIGQIVSESYDEFNVIEDMGIIGEDIFGHLFVSLKNGYGLFNIETAGIEHIANDFTGFLNKISSDIKFYTGERLVLDREMSEQLCTGYRYCPIFPFVLGGEYQAENLHLKDMVANIKFSSDLAKQIKNLPDGTKIKYQIAGKP